MSNHRKISASPDICFITLPRNWASGYLPYSYLVLTGYLEAHNFRAEIIDLAPYTKEFYGEHSLKNIYKKKKTDFDKDLYFKKIVDILSVLKPKFVGISVFTVDYFLSMELAGRIKEKIDCKIVMGNVDASIFPDDCIYENSPVDFVVIGEGEETLAELLETYLTGGDLKNVAGLYFMSGGKPIRTKARELMDISNLPLLPFDKIDMKYYLKPRQVLLRNLVLSGVDLFTGRGCPYFCEFCGANSIYKAQGVLKRVRYQSLDNVFANIEILVKKYRIDGLYIIDDTFTISENRVFEFCERIKPFKIYWGAETRVNLINPKMVKIMKESGCLQLDFGAETGSPEMLRKISKGVTVEQTIKAFKMCKEAGIRTLANILINLPGEEEGHIEETENLLKKIKPTVIRANILKPFPATPIFEKNIKMTHLEYIDKMEKILDGDLSFFKLCKHNMDLNKLQEHLLSYAGGDFRQIFRDFKISLRLILRSPRRSAYLYKIFKIFVVKSILAARKIRTKLLPFSS